jgi:uncharacterized protein YoxC
MAINLNVNGEDYLFPETDDRDWGNDVTDWASAITNSTLQKIGGDVALLNDLDLGSSAGLVSLYFKSRSENIAEDGVLRLSNTDTINFRNDTDDGDIVISIVDGQLSIDGERVGYRFLEELEDVEITSPTNLQYLAFTNGEWLNRSIEINDIVELNIVNPVVNDYIYFDGTSWSNKQFSIDAAVEEVIRTTVGDITQDLTGFPNRTDSVISFDDVAKSVTITPVGSQFVSYAKGVEIITDLPLTLNYSQTSGGRYIDIDPSTGQLIEKGTTPNIMNDLLCFYIYYNANTDVVVIKGDERHSSYRDTTWHRSKHLEDGMVLRSGGAISYTLSDPEIISVGISTPLVVADEDLEHSIQHSDTPTQHYQQILDGVAQIPVIYMDDTGYFTQDVPTTVPYKMGTSNVSYNSISMGVGSQVDVDNGKYVNYFIIATNCTKYPVKALQGRNQFDTLEAAQGETLEALGLPFPEITPIQQIVLKVDDTITENTYKVTIEAVYRPNRNLGANTSISADDHETLSGRTKVNSHPATAISVAGIVGVTGENVQEVIEEYKNKFDSVEDSISTIEGRLDGIDQSIVTIEEDINVIVERLDDHDEDITDIRERISGNTNVRNTVLNGPRDSNDKPRMFETVNVSGTNFVRLVKSWYDETPLQLSFANGFKDGAEVNVGVEYIPNTTFNLTNGLSEDTFYIFFRYNKSNKEVSIISNSLMPPIYSNNPPVSPIDGQWWYPTDHRHGGRVWDSGTNTWVDDGFLRIYVGEYVTNDPFVGANNPITYSYNGVYESGVFDLDAGTGINFFSHNLGAGLVEPWHIEVDGYRAGRTIQPTRWRKINNAARGSSSGTSGDRGGEAVGIERGTGRVIIHVASDRVMTSENAGSTANGRAYFDSGNVIGSCYFTLKRKF